MNNLGFALAETPRASIDRQPCPPSRSRKRPRGKAQAINGASLSVRAVDLFCGIGGLTHGFRQAGIRVTAGIDIDSSCRDTYEANNRGSRFIAGDIRDIADASPYLSGGDVAVLVGCAPCQPFSAHNRKIGTRRPADCSLVGEFARLVEKNGPDIVSMENVPGLERHRAFGDFLAMLRERGYRTAQAVMSCQDYGVPQTRRRLVLLASRLGEIHLPRPSGTKFVVADFLKGLPGIEDGQSAPGDVAHVTLPLSERNRQRIRQSKPGGTWKDWDEENVSACHRKANYPASYGRMRWDAPAPTITTQFCYYSTGRFGHPEQDRTISVREGALLQTFPGDYVFAEDGQAVNVREAARHIGNAVPVSLARAIGEAIMEHINGQ